MAMATSSCSGILEKNERRGLAAVPKDCIATIISFTTPPDACRFTLVSRLFLSASEFDVIWERFLPSDHELIVARSDGGDALLADLRNKKKQLYIRLADRPLLVDAASKSFQVEKSSGKKCWMMSARSLSISGTGSDTTMYWTWTSIHKSRFPEVAVLINARELGICGKIQISSLSPNTRYVAYLVFDMSENSSGLDNGSEASVCTAGGEIKTRVVHLRIKYKNLQEPRSSTYHNWNRQSSQPEVAADRIPKNRNDGWQELKIGEFFTDLGEGDGEVELSIREARSRSRKRGLIVEGIEVRPAGARDDIV